MIEQIAASLSGEIAASETRMSLNLTRLKALTFDIFGTVVDWRSALRAEGERLASRRGLRVDWGKFADAWRSGYQPAMDRVRTGELPWTNFDRLQRLILDRVLDEFGVTGLTEDEKEDFNRAWTRLAAWPDVVEGLPRLRRRYLVAALSNGNLRMLADVSKSAGLSWDCVLSAELAKHYKPDRQLYETALQLLGLQPDEALMVAAHKYDLHAARSLGMQTAFVLRPMEYGPQSPPDLAPDPAFDLTVHDFHELAGRLGA
jgi:2-haloacid dehalogenase